MVVKHVKTGRVAVATKCMKIGSTDYYYVARIDGDKGTNSSWTVEGCVLCDDVVPADLGYKPPPEFKPIYVRNTYTGRVGLATSKALQNGRHAYGILGPDGRRNTKWYVENCIKISKQEYDAADKTVKRRAWNKNIKYKAKKSDSRRRCKICNKPITNNNWWYCTKCNALRLAAASHLELVPANSQDPR